MVLLPTIVVTDPLVADGLTLGHHAALVQPLELTE
jgi:hypothetical protein